MLLVDAARAAEANRLPHVRQRHRSVPDGTGSARGFHRLSDPAVDLQQPSMTTRLDVLDSLSSTPPRPFRSNFRPGATARRSHDERWRRLRAKKSRSSGQRNPSARCASRPTCKT